MEAVRIGRRHTMKRALAALALVSAASAPFPQALSHPKGYVAYRATSPPSIDGRLTDGSWGNAPWSEDFVDIEGDARPRPRHQTRMKMLWDAEYLYVGADLVEPHLSASLTEHDSVIFRDNDFEVFIDPNGDNHEYYELEINALGTTWDLFLPKPYKDDGKALDGWEIAGLKTGVHLEGTLNDARDTDRGWTVELALPWKALGQQARRPSPPRDGDQWRINFSRVEWPLEIDDRGYRKPPGAKENNWVWSPQNVVDMHRPERWGYVQFSSRSSGPVPFVPNPDQPSLDFLHASYYAQREFRKTHGRWATTFQELALTHPAGATLQTAGALFEITVGPLHIRYDSLVWKQ
jgi:hypothetical protein